MAPAHPRDLHRLLRRSLSPIFLEIAALSLFVNLLALATPIFVMQVYDRVVFHAGLSTLQALCLGMVAVIVFDHVLRRARTRILQIVALRVDVTVGRALFEQLTALPLLALESRPITHWQALFRDVDTVRNTLSGASALLIWDLPFALLFLGLIFAIAAPVAWVLLMILPVFVLIAWRSGRVLTTSTESERRSALARDALIGEIIAGRTTVKALALDTALRPLWEQRHAETIERSAHRGAAADGYATLGASLTILTTVSMTAIGAMAVINQQLSIGALIAANMLSGRLLGPLNQLIANWRIYAGFRQALARLSAVLAAPIDRRSADVKLQRPAGILALDAVSFAFAKDGRPILDAVSTTLEPGGMTALIGRNGSGKTTLLKVMQGLYPPTLGRVLLDGADICQFGRSELAQWIGYVPQEIVLFADTLRMNIACRQSDADDDAIVRAARLAGAHGFIIDHPDGYAAAAGEAGHLLSAGQRQRIGIARALLGAPPVLLLDEPTASLDRAAEAELCAVLGDLARTRTVVVVTHSVALLAACRTAIVLDQGRIVLAGPAEQVLSRMQAGGSAPPPAPPHRARHRSHSEAAE